MRFAHPVLQERAAGGRAGPRGPRPADARAPRACTLQQFMTERLRLIDTDLDAVTWDAYRSDDGTWLVTGAWRAGDKSGTTRWTFDLPSRTVDPVRRRDDGLRRGHPPRARRPRRPRRPAPPPPAPVPSCATGPPRADDRPARATRSPPTPPSRPPSRTRTTTRCATCTRPAAPRTTTPSIGRAPRRGRRPRHRRARPQRGWRRPRTRAPASRRGRTSSSGSAATAELHPRPAAKVGRSCQCVRPSLDGPMDRRRHPLRRPGPALRPARLWPYARPYRGLIALTFAGALLATLAQLAVPLITARRRRRADRRRRPRRPGAAAGAGAALRHRRGRAVLPAPLGDEPAAACGSSATCATPSTSGCSGCRSPSTTAGPPASCCPAPPATCPRSAGSSASRAVFLVVNLITCVVVLSCCWSPTGRWASPCCSPPCR